MKEDTFNSFSKTVLSVLCCLLTPYSRFPVARSLLDGPTKPKQQNRKLLRVRTGISVILQLIYGPRLNVHSRAHCAFWSILQYSYDPPLFGLQKAVWHWAYRTASDAAKSYGIGMRKNEFLLMSFSNAFLWKKEETTKGKEMARGRENVFKLLSLPHIYSKYVGKQQTLPLTNCYCGN